MITRRSLFGFAAAAVVTPMLPAVATARAWGQGGYSPPVPLPLPQIPQRALNCKLTTGYVIHLDDKWISGRTAKWIADHAANAEKRV